MRLVPQYWQTEKSMVLGGRFAPQRGHWDAVGFDLFEDVIFSSLRLWFGHNRISLEIPLMKFK
jgi:hypothetical protein